MSATTINVPSRPHIKYPGGPSEFEIQSYLFTELRVMGLDCRGCVRAEGAVV